MGKNVIKVVVFLLLLGILGFLTRAYFFPKFQKFQKFKAEEKKIDNEIKAQEEEKNRLRKEAQNLEDNSFFVEKVARNKLGRAKKGETVYRFKQTKE